jgi:hypothetical protein
MKYLLAHMLCSGMRVPKALWFLPALVACTFQIASACGEDHKGSGPAAGQAPKDDRTVFVSVLMTNSGVVRDAMFLDGPTTLTQAAIKTVKQRRYTTKEVDNWSTSTPSGVRHATLAVTFPRKEGAAPKIHPGSPLGVPSCVQGGHMGVIVPPPSFLTSWPPVMPVLAHDGKK